MSTRYPIPRQRRRQDFVAGAGQVVFGISDFSVYDAADLRVRVRTPGGAFRRLPTNSWSATLSGAAPAFPTVTLANGRNAGDVVRIEGARLASRLTDVTLAGVIRSASLETELDRIAVTQQEVQRDNDDVVDAIDVVEESALLTAQRAAEAALSSAAAAAAQVRAEQAQATASDAANAAIRAVLGVFYPVVALGYIGDGQRHPLRSVKTCQGRITVNWPLFLWQGIFPRALSLDDEVDGHAVQLFWDLRPKGGQLKLPDGLGYSSYEIQTGGKQAVRYTGSHRDTTGLIFLNSLASGGTGFGVSHGRVNKADGTFAMSDMSLFCSGGAFQTALTVRFSGEQFDQPWCHMMNHVMIKGFNSTFGFPRPATEDYWRQGTVTYDIVRGLSWYDVVSICPNPEINFNDHHTLIVDYINRASNSYNYFNCVCYGGAYAWKFNYDGKAITQTHEEAQFWNCQGYDCIGLCSNRTINYSAPYSDNWSFYECQCANRGGPIYDLERTELVSIYGGLYGNNIALNNSQTLLARIKNCSVIKIKDVHVICARFNGVAQNFFHLYVEGNGNKEIIVEDYTVTNYGNFGAFVGFSADVPAAAYRDRGVQFNLGGPEPTLAWVVDPTNAQYSELRLRKAFSAAQAAGYITSSGFLSVDDAGNCILKDIFTVKLDANGDTIYNLFPGMVRRSPICSVDNGNILQPVGNVQPGLYPSASLNESILRTRFNYPNGANKTATTIITVAWSGG